MTAILGRKFITSAAFALGALGFAGAASAQFGPPPDLPDMVNHNPIFSADLGLGGPGQFTSVLDPKTDQLCYMLDVPGLANVVAAHIHKGKAGEDGPVAVPLKTPTDGASNGCATISPDLAKALVADPGDYYVNVHTKDYPGGATRGQLSAWDGPGYEKPSFSGGG